MNNYEILDFGNIHQLENELKIAKTTINQLQNNNTNELNLLKKKLENLSIQYNSLNIRHRILKAQNCQITKIKTNTKYINGKTISSIKRKIL